MAGREIPLDDLRWLRKLAEHLVSDPHAARDAVQETVLTALTRRPRDESSVRSWLRAILRNVLRQEWRRRARSRRLATLLDVRQSAPSAAELVEEIALHRRLVEQVHALDEPYRAVIVLRFLHERTPREIALDLGLSPKAVHTRIERALAKLRERLEADRRSWLVVLLSRSRSASAFERLRPALQFSVLLLGTAIVARYLRADASTGGFPVSVVPADTRVAMTGMDRALEPVMWRPRRQPLEPVTARDVDERDEAGLTPGFVCTTDGEPVPGIEIRFERERPEPWGRSFVLDPDVPAVHADARGRFALPVPHGRGRLTVVSDRLASVHRPYLDGAPGLETLVLVAGPRRAFEGRVVDAAGNPVEDASVEIMRGESYLQLLDAGGTLVNTTMPLGEERTDQDGRFRFDAVGVLEGAELVVRRSGFEVERFPLPPDSASGLELGLARADDERMVRGIVLDPAGMPASGAELSAGETSVRTGKDGLFALELGPSVERGILRAVRAGSLPAEESVARLLSDENAREHLVLQLGPPPLSISGIVLDRNGSPLAGARVFAPVLTPFGWSLQGAGEDWFLWKTSVEQLLAGQLDGEEASLVTTADEHGRFELPGLLDRAYTLFAVDPRTLDSSGPVACAAGERAVPFRLLEAERAPRWGRIVSTSGRPLAGVSIVPGLSFPFQDLEGAPAASFHFAPEAAVVTDADGFFSFPELPVRGTRLQVSGRELFESEFVHPDELPPGAEIRLALGARFRLHLADPSLADAFALLDEEGATRPVLQEAAGFAFGVPRVALESGRSGVVLAPEGEQVLVLYSGDLEVKRARVTLEAGGVREVEL